MAAKGGRPAASLIATLFAAPRRFGFFQAVRILERAARRRRGRDAAVGESAEPRDESVRFRADQSLAFPGAEIDALEQPERSDRRAPPRMTVSFFGLTGPQGVLPYHYTAMLVRGVRQKSFALRDFLDIFNHRLVSLFYRAWAKYRLPIAYERSAEPAADGVSTALRGIVGVAAQHQRSRTLVGDATLLHYGGLYGHHLRSAVGLESILSDYFQRPIKVEQFVGRWTTLDPSERSLLPSRNEPEGRYCGLGTGATIGGKVWDVQGSFRLHAGPLDYAQFLDFMPDGPALARLAELTRLYVGPDLVFDVQLTLQRDAVPHLRLEGGRDRPLLGWNTWLCTVPQAGDRSDAVFLRHTA